MKQALANLIIKIPKNPTWTENFKKYVPQFISEAETGKPWNRWNKDIFNEFFEKAANQCISSLKNGYFSEKERSNIKAKWQELAPLLQQLAENQTTPNYELYEQIRKLILSCTTNNKKAAIRRLIISLQPTLLSTILDNNYLYETFEYIRLNVINGDQLEYQSGDATKDNWFINSHHLLNFFRQELPNDNPMDIVTYPWQTRAYFKEENNPTTDNKNIAKSNEMSEDFIDKTIALLTNKKQIILQGPPGTGKTYTAKAIAKRLILNSQSESEQSQPKLIEQCKLIQFHPAYTYEDFVRGIVADVEDGKVAYSVKNKLLAKFAEKAYQNYIDSKKKPEDISKEQWLDKQFADFVDFITDELDNSNNNQIFLSKSVSILDVEEDAFRYGGENWQYHPIGLRMKYKDIKQAYLDGNKVRKDIVHNGNLSKQAREHATYFEAVLGKFYAFLAQKNRHYTPSNITHIELKNYVLIIDEINRANLPAVLGELIYALEYRDETVDSLYELDGKAQLLLPPNLYIIGTMNTADRSIGQIDYAIRRRFAFVHLLPQPLEENFDKELFDKVSSLFIENLADYDSDDFMTIRRSKHLSDEFSPEDVWLGHSYFIIKNMDERTIKLNYEIKPILKEYIKDGILKETAIEIINNL